LIPKSKLHRTSNNVRFWPIPAVVFLASRMTGTGQKATIGGLVKTVRFRG
jgi:hypothetical protein